MSEGLDTLKYWRKSLLQSVRNDGPDLTTRQTVVLLTGYMSELPHTLRGLARELGLEKPVVTPLLDARERLGYLKRKVDKKDRRSVLIQRTLKEAVYLRDFSDTIVVDALD